MGYDLIGYPGGYVGYDRYDIILSGRCMPIAIKYDKDSTSYG